MDDSYSMSELSMNWQKVKREIEELHHQRKKEGLEVATKKGLNMFIAFLYRSNDIPARHEGMLSFADLEMKPVNLKERFDFILARPGLFPAFIQLCELMSEQEKLYAKKKMMKKASGQNG